MSAVQPITIHNWAPYSKSAHCAQPCHTHAKLIAEQCAQTSCQLHKQLDTVLPLKVLMERVVLQNNPDWESFVFSLASIFYSQRLKWTVAPSLSISVWFSFSQQGGATLLHTWENSSQPRASIYIQIHQAHCCVEHTRIGYASVKSAKKLQPSPAQFTFLKLLSVWSSLSLGRPHEDK